MQFINLPTVDLGANLADWKNFAWWQGLGGSLDVMWDVEKAGIFTPPCALVDCTKVQRSGLADGWEAKLDRECMLQQPPACFTRSWHTTVATNDIVS